MLIRGAVVAFVLTVSSAADLRAQSLEEFYSKHPVQLISAFSAGGGNDIYCRAIARYLGKYLPGNPSVVVQNMPGAASVRAANYIYQSAPRDGTVFANITRTIPLLAVIAKNPNMRFDVRKFTWLGSSSSFADDAYTLFGRSDAAVKTIDDLRRPGGPPLILAGSAGGSTSNDVPVILRDVLGLNLKVITGYADTPAELIAIDRGEVDARIVTLSSVRASRPEWLNPGFIIRPMLQYARETRHPELPNIPTARELARNDRELALIKLTELTYKIARPFVAPPDLPPERARALQSAFMAVHKDPEFLADARKLQLDISPLGPDEALRYIDLFAQAPRDMLDDIKKMLIAN